MRRRLVTSYVLLVALALALFTVPVALRSADLLESTLEDTALREAQLFVPLVLRDDPAAAQAIIDRTRDFEGATGSRVVLVRAGDDTDDPQVQAALRGEKPGARWGRSDLLDTDSVSVVVPALRDGDVVAVVQVIAPADDVRAEIRGIWIFRSLVGLGVLALTTLVAVLLAGTIVRPLRRLTEVAAQIGAGRFDVRAETRGPPELVTLAETLNQTSRRTRALLQAQQEFVADASHQLRTPLTAMRLFVDNTREAAADPVLQARLDDVDGEMQRMARLVEQLLQLARAESVATPRADVDVAELARDRVNLWSAAGEDAAVRILARATGPTGPSGSVVALATPGSLEQVLDNLLDNAVNAAPPDSEVVVETVVVADRVRLSVCDTGPGMTPEQRDRAFDRFWSARPESGGSGLGLAVVRQLVEQDGGEVELTSPAGGGLEVVVWLRAARAAASSRHGRTQSQP